jgi:hypothetical protein
MIVNVLDNIKKIENQIDEMTREIHRLEGSLRVFREFAINGLTEVEVPGALPKEPEDEN